MRLRQKRDVPGTVLGPGDIPFGQAQLQPEVEPQPSQT